MAVQKSKGTRRRRGNRRGHDSLKGLAFSKCEVTGESHMRHHINAQGFYRGKEVISIKEADDNEE
jgi:large subunit ribosomal protein L32